MTLTPQQLAAAYLLKVLAARTSYVDFIQFLRPEYKLAPFHHDLATHVERLIKRTLTNAAGDPVYNLLVTYPPRHGKSELVTRLAPPFAFTLNPDEYILSCAYNAELAAGFGRDARNYCADPRIIQLNPATVIDNTTRSAEEWAIKNHGKYFGVGIDGTTTGRPATFLNIDDPIKSRAEAESQSIRNRVWNFYVSSLTSRLQPRNDGAPPIQIVTLTRWHPDDLAGRIMASDDWAEGRWLHINYPAISTDEDGVEHALWPAQASLDFLNRRKRLDPREFEALYQQRPFIQGGNLIREEWWRYYTPADAPETYSTIIITLDSAFQTKSINDYSVFVIAGLTASGDIHILDIIRRRLEYPDLRQLAVSLTSTYRGRGLRALYIEDRASGQSLIQDLRRVEGLSVIPRRVVHDKVTRATLTLPLIQGGRVYLPEAAPWLQPFLQEAREFPNSAHDDQIDAFSMAIDILAAMNAPSTAWHTQPSLNQTAASYGKSLSELIFGTSHKRRGRLGS